MADNVDIAQNLNEHHQRMALLAASSAPRQMRPIGSCFSCDEPLGETEKLFCDVGCSKDYERAKKKGY